MATRKPKMAREVIRERAILNQDKRIKELEADRETLEIKICRYMESACMYKAENEDLRADCKKFEEMLMVTRNALESKNMRYTEQVKINKELEKQLHDAEHKCDKLIEERYHLLNELEYARKPWWKKVFNK